MLANGSRMKRVGGMALALLLVFGAVGTGWARTATTPPAGHRVYDMKWLDINKWRCPFHNDGRYAYDPTRGGGEAGGTWPQPLMNYYIFGAGLWFGSLKPRADENVDTLVTFGYNPNSGGSEMTPASAKYAPEGAGDPADKVYAFPTDWPPPASRFAVDNAWMLGANRQDTLDPQLVPTENFSLQDMWCVYSDLGAESHIAPGYPQEIEIYQTIYAWNYPSNQDIFFLLYKVRNAGDTELRNCYVGALMDPDIGEHADDMVGLLLNDTVAGVGWVRDVGYVGDYNNEEVPNPRGQWEDGTPGVVAYKFLESPKRDSSLPGGGDTLVRMGMTAFKKFTIDIDPVTDQSQYLTMAGYDYRTGVFSPYDSVDAGPADKRFVQCSGPFNLAPGQVENLIVACIAAPYGGWGQSWESRKLQYNDSLVHLARVANAAQFIYDQGWLLPGPPVSPNITLVPGDNQVRIVWDNLSEITPDAYYARVASDPTSPGYDPKYLEYDFEGYVVYKSANGSDWGIIAQCDVADSVPLPNDTLPFEYAPGGDTTLPDSQWISMENSGILYSVMDDNVTNGFTYYYCVTAYDWNYATTDTNAQGEPIAWDTLILRSGIVSNYSMMPRWDAVNYVDPLIEVVTVVGDTVNPGFGLESEAVIPFEVDEKTYGFFLLGPEYVARPKPRLTYYVTDKSDGSIVIDTTSFDYEVGDALSFSLPVFNGQEMLLSLGYDDPSPRFDTAYVETIGYSGDLRPAAISSGDQASLWAWRGSDYRIEWEIMAGYGELTAKVYDETNGGIEVPFTPFATNQAALANGWCFTDPLSRFASDTLRRNHALFYICGGYFAMNYNAETEKNDSLQDMISEIQSGDVWMAVGNKVDGTAPFYNSYDIVCTPGFADAESTYTGLEVKVVPNPYIVFNAWESSTDDRRVKFTHLPTECTIRVFTLAGDLVKVLEHVHDGDAEDDGQPHEHGGTESWDFLNDNQQLIAAGVYVYHVESSVGDYTGKLVFIH